MSEKNPIKRTPRVIILAVFAVSIFIWFVWGVWGAPAMAKWRYGASGVAQLGQFGDLFGGINALFTALAFAAVWWTGILQREDLRFQHRELQDTRRVFEQQTFESTYFKQLSFLRELADRMDFDYRGNSYRGHEAAESMADLVSRIFSGAHNEDGLDLSESATYRDHAVDQYRLRVYRPAESSLGPYFRTMYHLFKMVDGAEFLTPEKKRQYGNVARGQLGSDELIILAANGLSPLGAKFKPLIERYGILKHMPRHSWFSRVAEHYRREAFLGADEV